MSHFLFFGWIMYREVTEMKKVMHARFRREVDPYRPFAPTKTMGETFYLLGMRTELVKEGELYMFKGGDHAVVSVERTAVCHESITRPIDNPVGLSSIGRRARIRDVLVDNQYPYAMHGLGGFCHALWVPWELIDRLKAEFPRGDNEDLGDYTQRIVKHLNARGFAQHYVELELGLNMLAHRKLLLTRTGKSAKGIEKNIGTILALCAKQFPELTIQQEYTDDVEFYHLYRQPTTEELREINDDEYPSTTAGNAGDVG